jgi:hypothetical protein
MNRNYSSNMSEFSVSVPVVMDLPTDTAALETHYLPSAGMWGHAPIKKKGWRLALDALAPLAFL